MTQGPKLHSEPTFPKENTMDKFSIPLHIMGKQNDCDETVAMQVLSLITSRFKCFLPVSSFIIRELQHFI